jgi:carbonic anhydrase
VPIELVFDQGFGDLFVVRVAGNVVAPSTLGSLDYAVVHLRTPLVLILGHESCGAVTAVLERRAKDDEPQHLQALLQMIKPCLKNVDPGLQGAARLSAAVEANVRWSMRQATELPTLKRLIAERAIQIVGAVYDLDSGRVRVLEDLAQGGGGKAKC